MTRKRHFRKKGPRPRRQRRGREQVFILDRDEERLIATEDRISELLYRQAGPLKQKEIEEALAAQSRDERSELDLVLKGLVRGHSLAREAGGFRLTSRSGIVQGKLSLSPRGNGFVSVVGEEKDIFLPSRLLKSATQGDLVLVRIVSRRGRGPEGRVVAILERGNENLVGIFKKGTQGSLVIPDDYRIPFNLMISKGDELDAVDGQAVVAEITNYEPAPVFPVGRIIEVLGDPEKLAVKNEMVIRKHGLPHRFSEAVDHEISRLRDRIEAEGREDLRGLPFVTIDGADARDFDDAVTIEARDKGFRLYVAIADVSHYVRPGSNLDQEAYQRGTSVYFPGRVVPMLPERLSNDLCSLVPGQDRYAFTAIIDFDPNGVPKRSHFVKSLIKSAHRFTYDLVNDLLNGEAADVALYANVLDRLKMMRKLAGLLEQRRKNRGAIMLEIPEREVILNESGDIAEIRKRERNQAHKMIEEFMLAANEAVATFLSRKGKAASDGFLYRIHEAPDPLKLEEFREFVARIGVVVRGKKPETWINRMLEEVQGSSREFLVNNLMLRSMQQARYDTANPGHFGLASKNYTHFTSPIRRYPDLMVHRALAHLCQISKQPSQAPADAGEHLSVRERKAIVAEREMEDILQVRFLKDRIGDEFNGFVSGVNEAVIFVELEDELISGAINLADLEDDFYILDDKNHRVIGKRSGRGYTVGDQIRVKVYQVDERRRRINFLPVATPA